ncbi:unnamed protein product [Heterobilharzia americana]|nr:unnamed protein product [Heterobilharzia americana]
MMVSLTIVFFLPVSLISLNSWRVLPSSDVFSITLGFTTHHCLRLLRRHLVNLRLSCFESSSWSEPARTSLLALISSDDVGEIQ